MKETILAAAILVVIASPGLAQQTESFDWEDGSTTVLYTYPNPDSILSTNVTAPDPVHAGSRSLRLEDNAASGTPQVYVAWITGLTDGDQVTASFWRYDDTPGGAPSCRIWGHWNDNPGDITGYSGSADGNSDYGPGTGWDQTSHTWTVVDGHTGLVIEVRTYSSDGDTVWIDDLEVTIPSTATFQSIVPVELQSFSVE
jgi:hypothetical protein